MSKLNELHDEAVKAGNEALAAEYNDLMLEVGRTQANAIDINGKILKRFEQRLSLTPAQLDILEAFEKLSSETSLTSPDGTVLLNHMRVTKRVKCEMRVDQVDPDVIDSGVCTLTLGTPEDSHTTQQKLNDYIASHPVEFKELIKNKTIRRAKNGAIQFDKKDAEAVTAVFNEAMVQEHKHSKEVIRREELKAQLKIIKSDTETLSSPIAGSVSGPVTALPRVEGEVARLPSSAALPPIHIMAKEEVPVEQHRERSTTIHIMAKDVPGEQNEEISTTPRP